jgi:alpha-1,2-mannosyltransferase
MALLAAFLYKTGALSALYRYFYSSRMGSDSWYPTNVAWQWFEHPHTSTLYQQIFFTWHIKFQYPPSCLLIFAAAQALHLNLTYSRLNLVGDTFVLIQGIATALIALNFSRWPQLTFAGKIKWVCASILIALLSLFCVQTVSGVYGGQVQIWLNCWFVLACLCWMRNRRGMAGALIGLICLIKPQFGLFLIWGAVRKEKNFILGWAAVVVPAELMAVAVFGLANNLDYFNALRYLASHGETYYPNQSFNGLINRLLGNGNTLAFEMHGFPPYNRTVYLFTLATTLLLVAATLLYRRRSKPTNVLDLMIAGLSFTIASPIAWEHHYGFVPAAILVAVLTVHGIASKRKRILLWIALGVVWMFSSFMPDQTKLPTHGWGSLLQSSMFFAVLCLLGLLYYLRDVAAQKAQPAASPSLEAATSAALPR